MHCPKSKTGEKPLSALISIIMSAMASQVTSLTIVYSTVYSDADQRKYQNSASLAFVRGIHRYRWIPRTKGQQRGKCFHLITSSWVSHDWPNSRIQKCTCSMPHIAPFKTEMCIFLFWMRHCGMWNGCILGFVKLVYYALPVSRSSE